MLIETHHPSRQKPYGGDDGGGHAYRLVSCFADLMQQYQRKSCCHDENDHDDNDTPHVIQMKMT